jgi:hypothetical protein
MRLLLDPSGDGGGAGSGVTPPAPAPTPAPEPVKPPTIQVDAISYARMQERLNALTAFEREAEAKRQSDLEAANRAHLAELAKKDGVEAALKRQADDLQSKISDYQQREQTREARLSREAGEKSLLKGIASANLKFASKAAADQAQRLLSGRAEVLVGDDGERSVVDSVTKRPFEEVVPELLASDEFSHFLLADRKGGSGSQGTGTVPATDGPRRMVDVLKDRVMERRTLGQKLANGNSGFSLS